MPDPTVLDRMRADWNERAREDAHYYVAFGRRRQDEREFAATAIGVVKVLEQELVRLPVCDAALEIGCGPGRLMAPLGRHFREIHGVDVSDEMVRLACERLRGIPNAHAWTASGTDLARFEDNRFDFVYSYAVFQHIPSREVVFRYLEEARRVLKPGGILRCQINGLPETARRYTTWDGVRVPADDLRAFAREQGLQLLALEGPGTQYMWMTCRKGTSGALKGAAARLRNVSNAHTGERAVPVAGALAALSLWVENLPPDADLNNLEVRVDGTACPLSYIGHPAADGVSQVNAPLPPGLRTGIASVQVASLGLPLCPPSWIRLIPPGPSVPRLCSVTDGVDLLAENRSENRTLKAFLVEVTRPEQFRAAVDGLPVEDVDAFCTDPVAERYEFNFRLPDPVRAGTHRLVVHMGKRLLGDLAIEVSS